MKGTLHKTDQGWAVKYEDILQLFPLTQYGIKVLPLHPDDVKEIEEDSKIFDNIEARIAAYPEVEFEIVDYSQKCKECGETVERGRSCTKGCFMRSGNFVQTDRVEYAKLKPKEEYPELEGTMNLCNDITKKRTGKMTEVEWQEAERAQTSTKTAMTSIEWLENELKKSVQYYLLIEDIIEQAKEMHREEILDAYIDRMDCTSKEEMRRILGGQYYQETFVNKGSNKHKEKLKELYPDAFSILGEVLYKKCKFEPTTNTSSATICKHCGREKFLHTT
jgi:hypothetical protein